MQDIILTTLRGLGWLFVLYAGFTLFHLLVYLGVSLFVDLKLPPSGWEK